MSATITTPALKEGMLFGAVLGVSLILLHWLSLPGTAGMLLLLSLALTLGVYLLAGLRAARFTGDTGAGAIAGLMTALVSSTMGLLVDFAWVVIPQGQLANMQSAINQALQQAGVAVQVSQGVLIGAIVIGLLVALLFSLLVGGLVGALGGSLGKRQYVAAR
ncbi:MAG TPA: hypothetical protein VF099_18670 [Ktedonobacterales bacterium]